jgi:hypothetical protein
VRRDERNGELFTCQTHREIFDTAALGKEFRLSGEPEADFVHPGLVYRSGYYGIELTAAGECDRLL